MRLVAPDIVLTHSPVDYMEDHTNACRLAVTAAFSRGMPNFPVTPPRPTIMKPLALYHAQPYSNRDPLRRVVTPDFYVDVTDREEAQGRDAGQTRQPETVAGRKPGTRFVSADPPRPGCGSGSYVRMFRYAEGWRRHLHLGFGAEQYDPLRDALANRIVEAARVNAESTDLVTQFREALTDCKRLYTQAARVALQDQPAADDDDAARHDPPHGRSAPGTADQDLHRGGAGRSRV